jgi:transposase-like protein
MTTTIGVVPDRTDQQQLARQLVDADRAEDVELVGSDSLLTGLTKTVLETAWEAEMSGHPATTVTTRSGAMAATPATGTRIKTVLTEIGPVRIEVPRDRDAGFDHVIVRKRQRPLDGIDETWVVCPSFSGAG